MYILKHSMASALALLFITGTQAQGSLASKGATMDRSAQAVQNRATECLTQADYKNCRLEAEAAYPKYNDISKRNEEEKDLSKTEHEVLCKGLFVSVQCKVRLTCKKCPGDEAKKEAALSSTKMKTMFTDPPCNETKPPGALEMSCPNDMSSPRNSVRSSTENSAENSADKTLPIIIGVAGILVVFGLIGVLLFFFVFKKKDDGSKSAPGSTASRLSSKRASSKTGQSTTGGAKSSMPKSSVRGTKLKTKAKWTTGGAKSSKSTTT